MDKFSEAELKGRTIFNNLLSKNIEINNINFTEDKFASYDVEYISGGTKHFVVELKYRPTFASTAKTVYSEGVLLEKEKYDKLIELSKKYNYEVYYVTMFNDGIGFSFNLNKIKPIFYEKKMPWKTCNKQLGDKIKLITMLQIKEGKKFYF